jgi:hypothetical protein
MRTNIKVLIRTEVRDARAGKSLRWRKARHNLVFDSTLTALALGTINFASIFETCKIGSSNAANSRPGNTVTFTQIGNTITASAPFFAGGDVGSLFKYGVGTGGAEQYISHFTDNQHVDVAGAGMAVVIATPGTVWFVTQTALTTPLVGLVGGCESRNYVVAPGACSTTFPGGANSTQITMQRTFQFPVQAAPYTVNEIGYSDDNANNGTCRGRLVLGAPDAIAITEYYVVQIQITYTVTPNVPTAVANVVTGFDSSGNVMFNFWDCRVVLGTGLDADYQSAYSSDMMDSTPPKVALKTTAGGISNAHIAQAQEAAQSVGYVSAAGSAYTNAILPVGVAQTTISFAFNTVGETVYALYFVSNTGGGGVYCAAIFSLILTTPFVLPTGTFNGYLTYQRTITRTLSN